MSRGIQKVGTDLVCELANVFVSKTKKIPKAKEVRNCSLYKLLLQGVTYPENESTT